MSNSPRRVAVVGASDNPDRYSYRAIRKLQEHGHTVLPVTSRPVQLPGLDTFKSLLEVPPPVDTVTLYVNSHLIDRMADDIIAVRPARVIFNPGTENSAVAQRLREAGIQTVEACTLVLLGTGQFD
jgi:predicted CoA-binding protein